jgi:DNA-binding NarL/FixJ family response regulator
MTRKPASSAKRILIVDSQAMMRQGLAQLINREPDLAVCSEAGTAAQALGCIPSRKPDLVLADFSLPDKNGLELIKDIHALQSALPVLVVSMHDEALYAERVLRAGGRGYIMKQEGGRKLMRAIRKVLGGGIYVSDKVAARILELFSGGHTLATRSPLEHLTDREFEVFHLIGSGKTTREIAAHLHLSIKTVEVHRANIKRKLKLQSGAELVCDAIRWVQVQSPAWP